MMLPLVAVSVKVDAPLATMLPAASWLMLPLSEMRVMLLPEIGPVTLRVSAAPVRCTVKLFEELFNKDTVPAPPVAVSVMFTCVVAFALIVVALTFVARALAA